jgi:hypothetical protein
LTTTANKDLIQVCLAEYSTLRDEILMMIRWRQNLIFASIGASGALFSFALTQSSRSSSFLSAYSALYLIAPICTLTGALWIDGAWITYRIQSYIDEVLCRQINLSLVDSSAPPIGDAGNIRALAWGNSAHRSFQGPAMRFVGGLSYIGSFVLPGVIGQLVFGSTQGTVQERLHQLGSPILYALNWLLIFAALVIGFVSYLIKNRRVVAAQKHWMSR